MHCYLLVHPFPSPFSFSCMESLLISSISRFPLDPLLVPLVSQDPLDSLVPLVPLVSLVSLVPLVFLVPMVPPSLFLKED